MSDRLVVRKTPEDEELDQKQTELSALEHKLIQRELDLTTFHAELHSFEQEYLQIVGSRYAELEHIEAQINEYMSYLESSRGFKASESLKKLYREVAKRIHPDLVTDEGEKVRRQELMTEANQAYEEGNEEKLKAILHNWETRPESVKGEGLGAELIRIIRKIAQCRERLKVIEAEIEALEQTELYQLKTQVVTAKEFGQDLLAEMARHLDEQITAAQQRLRELKEQLGLHK